MGEIVPLSGWCSLVGVAVTIPCTKRKKNENKDLENMAPPNHHIPMNLTSYYREIAHVPAEVSHFGLSAVDYSCCQEYLVTLIGQTCSNISDWCLMINQIGDHRWFVEFGTFWSCFYPRPHPQQIQSQKPGWLQGFQPQQKSPRKNTGLVGILGVMPHFVVSTSFNPISRF